MNRHAKFDIRHSTCPHDCPSACALDIEVIDGRTIGRVRGSKRQTYTAGVICAKVARYAERIHHPERLLYPMRRAGAKGSGQFVRISWDEALDEIAARFDAAEREFGAESVWPYYYAGTMGLVMRDGINRLSHVKKYSRFYSTICANIARVGFLYRHRQDCWRRSAGNGSLRSHRDLGNQSGEYPSQRHDTRDACPEGAGRQDCCHRYLQQRHDEAGRRQDHPAAGHRWCLRLRRHACPIPRRLRRSGVHGPVHRLPG